MKENNNLFGSMYKDYLSTFEVKHYDYDFDKLDDILKGLRKSTSEIKAEKLQKDRQAKIKEIFG